MKQPSRQQVFLGSVSPCIAATVIFILIVLASNQALKQLPTIYKLKQELLDRNIHAISLIILGSSHPYYGLIARKLDPNGQNFANNSHSILIDCLLLRKNLDRLSELHTVIFDIAPFSFAYKLTSGPEPWRDYFLWHWQGVSERQAQELIFQPDYWSLIPTFGRDWIIEHFKLGNGVYAGLVRKQDRQLVQDDGSAAHTDDPDKFIDDGKQRATLHNQLIHLGSRDRGNIIAELEKTIHICQQHHIRVIFVSMPVHSSYILRIDAMSWRHDQETLNRLCAQYKINYFNYTGYFGSQQRYFRNSDHLNLLGASFISEDLSKRLTQVRPDGFNTRQPL